MTTYDYINAKYYKIWEKYKIEGNFFKGIVFIKKKSAMSIFTSWICFGEGWELKDFQFASEYEV